MLFLIRNIFLNANFIFKELTLKWPNDTNSEGPHEYHEISDDEVPTEKIFDGKSLLDEMDYMFRSMTANTTNPPQSPDFDHTNKRNEITELASKLQRKNSGDPCSSSSTGTGTGSGNKSSSKKNKNNNNNGQSIGAGGSSIKQISHKDEKILNHAIEIANEISARSMTDLFTNETNSGLQSSPKRKFSFKFPHLTSSSNNHNGNGSNNGDKDSSSGSNLGNGNGSNSSTLTNTKERKNFSEELKNVSDLQVCVSDY